MSPTKPRANARVRRRLNRNIYCHNCSKMSENFTILGFTAGLGNLFKCPRCANVFHIKEARS